jgi:hypothetical protein
MKYQDHIAKDEYCKVGQRKDTSSAIYDSMQFLSMKREKSMYNNDESNSYLKREKSNPLLKYQSKNPHVFANSNDFEFNDNQRISGKINNDFTNQTFIVRSNNQGNRGHLNENISMNNLLCESYDETQKQTSPNSINSKLDHRNRNLENNHNRQ